MNLSAEEILMYKVMRAIYESGIPMSFKGSMVLKAFLLESGYSAETRHTVDIDGNWFSDVPPMQEQMAESIQKALKKNRISLDVHSVRPYAENRSAGFDLMDAETGEFIFSMDIEVNRPVASTHIYEIDGVCFRGISPSQMIADKIDAISSDRVLRRIKDVVDLYYLSSVFSINKQQILENLRISGKTLGTFDAFLHRVDELRHAYEKFRFAGDIEKVMFDELYRKVKIYINDFLPQDGQ